MQVLAPKKSIYVYAGYFFLGILLMSIMLFPAPNGLPLLQTRTSSTTIEKHLVIIQEGHSLGGYKTMASSEVDIEILPSTRKFTKGEAFVFSAKFNPVNQSSPVRKVLASSSAALRLAGAEISPSSIERRPIGDDLIAEWSVNIDKAGSFEGYIELVSPYRVAGWRIRGRNGRFNLSISAGKVPSKGLQEYLAPFAFILGLIIALTNIVRFIWAWIDRERKWRKELQGNDPKPPTKKLILPENFDTED